MFNIDPKSNLAQRNQAFCDPFFRDKSHSQDIDIVFIRLSLLFLDIKLYAITPNSPICEILPLAPIQNQTHFNLENKPKGYICDWIKPPRNPSPLKQKLKNYGIDSKNIYAKAILDLIRLCKAIIYALKN